MSLERTERLRAALQRRQADLTVLMDRVHKPHNFAAILRSCDAVGVDMAHAVASSSIVCRKRLHHTAAGSIDWVGVKIHDSCHAAIDHLRERGHSIWAAHPSPRAVDFRDVDFTKPTAIMLGTELEGLDDDALARADGMLNIPMLGLVDSLNVSVAAALLLFEAQRQRLQAGLYSQPHFDEAVLRERLFEWRFPKIASHCRARGLPYPRLDDDGGIPSSWSMNTRDAASGLHGER